MDAPSAPNAKPTQVPAPFDNYDSADVILRSSDQYEFHAHKLVLGLASPFFKQMLSLSQPAGSSTTDSSPIPVIPVSEDHETIDYLLRLCYPILDPTPPGGVAATAKILEAAMKYDLEEATVILKKTLLRFVPTHPLTVYAHACRLRLENEASNAATHWRENNKEMIPNHPNCYSGDHPGNLHCANPNCVFRKFSDTVTGTLWVEDMKAISAGCLYRLLHFVRTGALTSFCDPPLCPPSASNPPTVWGTPPSTISPITPLHPTILTLCPQDIILKSSDSKLIHTHKTLLAFAGALGLLNAARRSTSSVDGIPLIDVDADENTVQNLLRICQPYAIDIMTTKTFTTRELHKLWDVAQIYGMRQVKEVIKLSWTYHITSTPLPVYLTAKKHGWAAEAEKAADQSSSLFSHIFDEGGYTPEMESSSAEILYELYGDQHARRKARRTQKFSFQGFGTSGFGVPPPSNPPATSKPFGGQTFNSFRPGP